MQNTKTINIVIGSVSVFALILGFLAWGNSGKDGRNGRDGVDGKGGESYGISAGPDRTNPTESINEVRRHYYSTSLNQASTTICSFKTPAATTTLEIGTLQIRTGTTTTISLEIGKSVSQAATTTRLAYVSSLASAAQITLDGAFTASTTGAYGAKGVARSADENDKIFSPSTYLNVKYGGAAGSLNVLAGSCKATFLEN